MTRVGTQQPVRVEVHASVGAVADEWDRLADAAKVAPFLRPAWTQAWWEAFGGGRLEIVTLRQGGSLTALIPLHRRLGRRLSASNWHTPQFGMVTAGPDAAAALAATLFERRPFELSLGFVDASSPELELYRDAAAAARYRVLERTLERSPYVTTTGTWEAFARERLSRNRRSQLGRARRRLEREGRVGLEIAHGRERPEELLAEAFRVEASGWKGDEGTAITSRPETLRFYREIARWAAGQGWLRIAFLRLDGRALATMLLLETGGVLYYLKGGYDPLFDRFSPGVVLLGAVIEHACGSGIERVELLGGDERYKLAFTSDVKDKMRFQAFAPTPLGLLSRSAFSYGRPVARRALDIARRARGAKH
ncbi:MAG TPA: GNAT family N-acetyltransferase [Actinomycetota bacterium]|nr:GNAT family N-acetyltransferase [Actinomycetota bacterium]